MKLNKDYLIQLTIQLYKLTLLFPKKEPLRYKMREVADNILAQSLSNNLNQTLSAELKVLDSFFKVAENQNWVSKKEILALEQEYSQLAKEIEKISQVQPRPQFPAEVFLKEKRPQPILTPSFNERQKKILEILREKGRAQVWEMKEIFPGISKRTLRRDFENLLKKGMVERLGERNTTFYRLKTGQS